MIFLQLHEQSHQVVPFCRIIHGGLRLISYQQHDRRHRHGARYHRLFPGHVEMRTFICPSTYPHPGTIGLDVPLLMVL